MQTLESQPLVSVIMPSYNTAQFVSESIESVFSQTYKNVELIVVDDCSSDDSDKILSQLAKTYAQLRYLKLEKNGGAAVARNAALEQASGRFIAFLDSDDLWLPQKLERQIAYMLSMDVPLSFTAYEKIDEAGKVIGKVGAPPRISYRGLLKTNIIGCLTAVYDTKYFGRVPMPLLRKRQDFALWLTLLRRTPFAYGMSEVLAKYRVRQESISANKKKAALYNWKLYREVEKLSFIQSCWYFAHYAIRGVLRTKFPGLARKLRVLE